MRVLKRQPSLLLERDFMQWNYVARVDARLRRLIERVEARIRDDKCDAAASLQLFQTLTTLIEKNNDWSSPKVFQLGALILRSLPPDSAARNTALVAFPDAIRSLLLALHTPSTIFQMKCRHYPDHHMYIVGDISGNLCCRSADGGEQGSLMLRPIDSGGHFVMSSVAWPYHTLYVCSDLIGGLLSSRASNPGPQGHLSIIPYNRGEYFMLSSEEWPRWRLNVRGDALGIVKSVYGPDPGLQGHFKITVKPSTGEWQHW
jgi:hypothetical protein